jgi:hypothetical protein
LAVAQIVTKDGWRVAVQQIPHGSTVVPTFDGAAYVGVIWALDNTFDQAARMQIGRDLIQSGCRYIVCGGVECEQWHDDADLAQGDLDRTFSGNMPFVMTTWHEREPLEEVLWFANYCTAFEDYDFKCILVLVIGDDPFHQSTIEVTVRTAFGS